jgi:serine/threonine protein kinase
MSAINKSAVAQYFGFDDHPHKIRDSCENDFYVKKEGADIFKEGGFGSISEVCHKTKCNYVAKVIPLAIPSVKKTFLREAVIAPVMGEVGIGPKVVDVFSCLNAGFIIMETWDGSLGSLLEKEKRIKNKDLEKIGGLLDRMHRLGVIHNDMHTGNVLYRDINGEREFSITDYGLSLRFSDANQILPPSEIPNSASPNIYFPAFDYHRIGQAIQDRLGKIFLSYFLEKGYLTLLEYVLVDRYFYSNNTKNISFLEFLQDQKIARNMIRTFPRNPEEIFLPLGKNSSRSEKQRRKTTKGETRKTKTSKTTGKTSKAPKTKKKTSKTKKSKTKSSHKKKSKKTSSQ